MPAGEYHVYAVITDGTNDPVIAYSGGTVIVTEPAPEIVTFAAESQTITAGESVTLAWEVVNASGVSIDQGVGTVGLTGSATVRPAETTTFTLAAGNSGGTVTAAATVTVAAGSPITLNITSPAEGETLSRPYVMVRGTVTSAAGNETGVTVNGVLAIISGNEFTANHVPLQEGENTLTVVVTDAHANTAETSVTVNAETTADHIRITPVPESALPPFETTLTITASFSFAQPSVTYTGAGDAEFLENGTDQFKVRISGEGMGYLTAEVTDTAGSTYTDTVAVTGLNRDAHDLLLKAEWDRMRTALINGDTESALDCFHEGSRPGYQEMFDVLADRLPEIASAMREPELIYLIENIARYRIRREETVRGTVYDVTYYICFIKGGNGLWKIEGF